MASRLRRARSAQRFLAAAAAHAIATMISRALPISLASALVPPRQDRQSRRAVCRTWCRDFAGAANRGAGRRRCIRDGSKTFIHRLRRFTQIFRYESYNLRKPVKSADQIAPTRRPWYRPSLTTQIMIGLVGGALLGWLRPDSGNKVYFLRDIFLNLIKSIIAPLI